jgi:hypothetical protein
VIAHVRVIHSPLIWLNVLFRVYVEKTTSRERKGGGSEGADRNGVGMVYLRT